MPGYYDIHCHLLFGVDDGPEKMEESAALLQREYKSGVRTIYLTPHYRKNMFECAQDIRLQNFEVLKDWAARNLPDLKLHMGCEVHVSTETVQNLREGKCSAMGDTDFVLIEFRESADKRYIINKCHEIMHGGYCPIIAHAERCATIRKNMDLLQRLVDMGVYVQMNAGSIIGKSGLRWKWFCQKAMKRNLLHFVGSDAHNLKKQKPNLDKCARYLEKKMGAEYRDQIMILNPKEIIEGSV